MRINQPRKNNHKSTGFHYQKDRSTRKWREFEEEVMNHYHKTMEYYEPNIQYLFKKSKTFCIPTLKYSFRVIAQRWEGLSFGTTDQYIQNLLNKFPLKYKLYWKKKLEIK